MKKEKQEIQKKSKNNKTFVCENCGCVLSDYAGLSSYIMHSCVVCSSACFEEIKKKSK